MSGLGGFGKREDGAGNSSTARENSTKHTRISWSGDNSARGWWSCTGLTHLQRACSRGVDGRGRREQELRGNLRGLLEDKGGVAETSSQSRAGSREKGSKTTPKRCARRGRRIEATVCLKYGTVDGKATTSLAQRTGGGTETKDGRGSVCKLISRVSPKSERRHRRASGKEGSVPFAAKSGRLVTRCMILVLVPS